MTSLNVGFKIANSGDSVVVDIVDNENGAFITSPIMVPDSATVTRNADSVQATGILNATLNLPAASVIVQANALYGFNIYSDLIDYAAGAVELATTSARAIYSAQNGVFSWGTTSHLVTLGVPYRAGVAWENGLQGVVLNGGIVVDTLTHIPYHPLSFITSVQHYHPHTIMGI